jgi:hypothetical protein
MAEMGRQELIGDGENQLIPHYKAGEEQLVYEAHRRKNKGGEHQKRVGKPVQAAASKPNAGKPQGGKVLTQHTGLPPKPSHKPKQRGGR